MHGQASGEEKNYKWKSEFAFERENKSTMNGVKKGIQPVKCPPQTTTIITKSVSTNLSNIPDYLNSKEHKKREKNRVGNCLRK